MSFGWDSVNRDGYRNQKRNSGKKKGGGCKGKAASFVFWGLVSAAAITKGIVESFT